MRNAFNQKVKSIVIFMAMQCEAEAVINELQLTFTEQFEFTKALGLVAYASKANVDQRITVVVSGKHPRFRVDQVGTQFAAVATYEIIRVLRPDLIINAGTAGGINAEAQVGDVFIAAEYFQYYDRKIPLGSFHNYGYGNYVCLAAAGLNVACNLKSAVLATGSSLKVSLEYVKELQNRNVFAVDMEAAAVAEIAALFGQRILAVKVISDIVGPAHIDQFAENVSYISIGLAQALQKIISFIYDHYTLKDRCQRLDSKVVDVKPG